MSRPRFFADEDLRGSIVRAVRRIAPDVELSTIVERGMASATDDDVLDFAWQDKWLLVSHDVNTLKAVAERRIKEQRGLHGLFVVPQNRSTREVAECLHLIWSGSDFEEWQDRIVYVPF
jgi:hypothetical protein